MKLRWMLMKMTICLENLKNKLDKTPILLFHFISNNKKNWPILESQGISRDSRVVDPNKIRKHNQLKLLIILIDLGTL